MKIIKSKIIIKNISINKFSKIIDAVSRLEKTKFKFLIVVDKNNFFLGVLNDGDIRRGLLSGYTIEDKIKKIFNKNPVYLKKMIDESGIEKLIIKKDVNFIPIIKNKKVERVFVGNNDDHTKIKNKLVIMAGGKGTRLGKFTKKIPKPMLKIKGRPIMDHLIENSKKQGVFDFIISVNYLGSVISNYFKNGKSRNINIKYIKEKLPLGTAGSLYFLKNEKNDLLVTNADLITNVDFSDLLKFHKDHKSDFTVVIKKINWSFPYGAIKYKNFKLIELNEKPMYKSEVIAGVYALNPRVLKEIKKPSFLNITDLINKLISLKKNVHVYPIYEEWTDIGSYNDYLKMK